MHVRTKLHQSLRSNDRHGGQVHLRGCGRPAVHRDTRGHMQRVCIWADEVLLYHSCSEAKMHARLTSIILSGTETVHTLVVILSKKGSFLNPPEEESEELQLVPLMGAICSAITGHDREPFQRPMQRGWK